MKIITSRDKRTCIRTGKIGDRAGPLREKTVEGPEDPGTGHQERI